MTLRPTMLTVTLRSGEQHVFDPATEILKVAHCVFQHRGQVVELRSGDYVADEQLVLMLGVQEPADAADELGRWLEQVHGGI